MGHILSRYYKFGEITEDEMKNRLGINETKEEDCGCNPINEQPVAVHNRTSNGNIVTTLKESDLNEQETILYEFGKKVTRLLEKMFQQILQSGHTTKLMAKKSLMFTLQNV